MNKEPINPSYINQIFEISKKETQFNNSEFVNATVEDKGLKFDYEVDILKDFIRLNLTIKYIQKAKETDYDLEVLNFFRGFRIVKMIDIYPKDLLVVLEYCINLLNENVKKQNPPLKYLPKEFAHPVWEDHILLLKQIALDLNGKVQYP